MHGAESLCKKQVLQAMSVCAWSCVLVQGVTAAGNESVHGAECLCKEQHAAGNDSVHGAVCLCKEQLLQAMSVRGAVCLCRLT